MSKVEDLQRLEQEIVTKNLPLKETATNIVFGKGNPEADIMFIGEAPGRNEDLEGYPFVGAAGKQLDGLLQSIGLGIDDVYIANILKYRPPKNRNPQMDEIKKHTPYLLDQIKIIQPKIICTLGNFATKFVLGGFSPEGMKNVGGITTLHGSVKNVQFSMTMLKVMPSYHPAAMLYNPNLRTTIEQDFKVFKEIIS
jgi:uracil-DNA glycosylase family 4